MTLCATCGDKLANHLCSVSELCHDLDITLARLDVLTIASGRGGDAGLPFAPAASDAHVLLVSTVLYWAQQVAQARSSHWNLPDDPAELAMWLMYRLDWLRALPGAGLAYTRIDTAVTTARRVIDRPMHRTSFPVGPCPEVIATRYCVGVVWAYVPVRIGVDPAVMRCRNPECRRHTEPWTTGQWDEAGRRILRRAEVVKSRSGDRSGRSAPVWRTYPDDSAMGVTGSPARP